MTAAIAENTARLRVSHVLEALAGAACFFFCFCAAIVPGDLFLQEIKENGAAGAAGSPPFRITKINLVYYRGIPQKSD